MQLDVIVHQQLNCAIARPDAKPIANPLLYYDLSLASYLVCQRMIPSVRYDLSTSLQLLPGGLSGTRPSNCLPPYNRSRYLIPESGCRPALFVDAGRLRAPLLQACRTVLHLHVQFALP